MRRDWVAPAGAQYLALGYKPVERERLLMQFIAHLEQAGAQTVTIDAAVAWPVYWRRRLSAALAFAGTYGR